MIVVEDLVKNYGSFQAVKGINLKVEDGQIVGLLGPNGAGKSTTMNIITGYISATSGSVEIDGYNIMAEPMKAKSRIGYLPEIPPLYMDMTVLSYLKFVAEIKGVVKKERLAEVKRVMKITKITDRAQRMISKLSKGYRQRVGLAAALLGNPPILILDEPTVGLDPSQVVEIRELIRSLAHEHTVILSSHILSEVSEVCDHIIIINNGTVVAEDTPENLSRKYSNQSHVAMEIKGDKESIGEVLDSIDYIESYEFGASEDGVQEVNLLLTTDEDRNDDLFYLFAGKKMPVRKVSRESLSLEEVFLKLTGEEKPQKEEDVDVEAEDAEGTETVEETESVETAEDNKEDNDKEEE
ncbi:MAG: ABC transporter ATP-binding protein [Lachnospiraceae bacterium]|nr:ABC transporter ATP-binding protein [Lachnospiraceae bacterium]